MYCSAVRPGDRSAATVPMWVSSGPTRPPVPSMKWHRAQSSLPNTWRPLASGSVAGGSAQATIATATTAAQAARSRLIIGVLESRAALRAATVVLGDRAVLRSADLEVGPGITLLRGANGAGKTTALRALAGLLPLTAGRREAPEDILYLGHRPQLLHGLTARENLAFFAAMRGGGYGTAAALSRWGLGAEADRPVERLSAGQRRRAALARLDVERPRLLLLDEPFAELDEEATALLRAELRERAAGGDAVLVASHGHPELDRDASAVRTIAGGQVA